MCHMHNWHLTCEFSQMTSKQITHSMKLHIAAQTYQFRGFVLEIAEETNRSYAKPFEIKSNHRPSKIYVN